MIPTFPIEGSTEVMAPYYDTKKFVRGERVYVKVTASTVRGEILLPVRQALIGMVVPTIFTKAHLVAHDPDLARQIPEGARLAYAGDISEALDFAGKHSEAAHLRMEFKRKVGTARSPHEWNYTLWSFMADEYEIPLRN